MIKLVACRFRLSFILLVDEDFSDDDCSNDENPRNGIKLEGSIISMEFAPLTKGIRVTNIPEETTLDSIKFRFSNPKIGGGKVTDIMLDENYGVANVYFEKSSGIQFNVNIYF